MTALEPLRGLVVIDEVQRRPESVSGPAGSRRPQGDPGPLPDPRERLRRPVAPVLRESRGTNRAPDPGWLPSVRARRRYGDRPVVARRTAAVLPGGQRCRQRPLARRLHSNPAGARPASVGVSGRRLSRCTRFWTMLAPLPRADLERHSTGSCAGREPIDRAPLSRPADGCLHGPAVVPVPRQPPKAAGQGAEDVHPGQRSVAPITRYPE